MRTCRALFVRWLLWVTLALVVVPAMAQYTQMTNLPTVYIDTYNKRSITSKTSYIFSTLTFVDEDGAVTYDSVQIRGRGNSTWGLAKKPYRFRFKESTRFLGKGYAKARSWTLLANHADKSLIRNAVTFDMGQFVGLPYNPASLFVDLVLNGTYLGSYQISDQINVDKKRVNIVEQETRPGPDDDISGGYLMEVDGFGDSPLIYTSKSLYVSLKSPDSEVLTSAQRDYVREFLNDFENRLFGKYFDDGELGYRVVADSATLVVWYIASELSANSDCFWSTYLYKDQGDPKLYFGPLWDYDIAYNNDNRLGDCTRKMMTDAAHKGSNLTNVWVERMLKDPWFNKSVNRAWTHLVEMGLEEHMLHCVDSLAEELAASQELNYSKYSIRSRVYDEIYLYSTYDEYIAQLKSFITNHMAYLTTVFASRAGGDTHDDELEPFKYHEGYYVRITNRGTDMVLDIDGNKAGAGAVVWKTDDQRETQKWVVKPVGKYYQILNSVGDLALHDPSPTADVGTQLNTAAADKNDKRQLWDIVTVNENGNYNLINVATGHAINNKGGGTNNGNPVLSYTSDGRNSESANRQWRIRVDTAIPDYISEEVMAYFTEAMASVDAFLAGLTEDNVGEDTGQYPADEVAALKMLAEWAHQFQSTSEEDYIYAAVALLSQLEAASAPIPMSEAEKKLLQLTQQAKEWLASIDRSWIGTEPFQLNGQLVDELTAFVAKADGQKLTRKEKETCAKEMEELVKRAPALNAPPEGQTYHLLNTTGWYLSSEDGFVFTSPEYVDSLSVFTFVPAGNTVNTYYLYTQGAYLSTVGGSSGRLSLTPSPRSYFGKLIIEQTGPHTFRMLTSYGPLGADEPITEGTECNGKAQDASTTEWKLVEAVSDESGIEDRMDNVDYAVKYNASERSITFVSDNMDVLQGVEAHVSTISGMPLFTFEASKTFILPPLPSGTYVLSWKFGKESKAIRFMLKDSSD